MRRCPNCNLMLPRKSKIDIESLDKEKLQYALDNFAGILKNAEYYENNLAQIRTLSKDLLVLATTGYYVSLGSLIRNEQGMDYTKIFKIWEISLEENKDYPTQNEVLRHNIEIIREWESSLAYEMEHVLKIRDKYMAHIDFVDNDFFVNSLTDKDLTKQNDLVKFFSSIIEISRDYTTSVCADVK